MNSGLWFNSLIKMRNGKQKGNAEITESTKTEKEKKNGELWWLLKSCFFDVPRKIFGFSKKNIFFLGKGWFLEVVGSKSQLFPRKKLVFAMHGL